MFITSPLFIICSNIVLFFVLIAFIARQKAKCTQSHKTLQFQIETQELLLNELQSSQKKLNSQFSSFDDAQKNLQLETEQVTKQLEHRIKVLQEENNAQQQLLEQIKNQQPQDKLYSRAFKLVELGADIDEVVRECDIPRAEAEMLISVHKNKTCPP